VLQALAAAGALSARAAHAPPAAGEATRPPPHPRLRRSGLDDRVALLTRALDLDAEQQASVRKVLLEAREDARRIWSDASLPSAQRIASTKGLSRRTGDRIRAVLTPDQRERFDPPPREGTANAVANAHIDDWMNRVKR
jgi:hypothetical protein